MTIQTVQALIAQLQQLDPADPQIYNRAISIFEEMKHIPFLVLNFPTLPIIVYRTRTHETDNLFENFSDIGLPPAGAVSSFGRCNVPGQPVFYCSDSRGTSYLELLEYWVEEKKEPYLHVTIGRWTINHSFRAAIITSPFAAERTSEYDRSQGKALDNFINNSDPVTKEALILFYKFLFDVFRKPAKKDLRTYAVTSAYSDLAYTRTKGQMDGIFYPSVPGAGVGVNFAIKQDYDFANNCHLEVVGKNTFKRMDSKPLPSFEEEGELRIAAQIDHANRRIIW
jgi:hypothetical protein